MKLLKSAWKKWLSFAHIIGNFQAQVLFTVFYFIVLSVVGLILRYFSDPLNIKPKNRKSNFNEWEHPEESLEMARKPY